MKLIGICRLILTSISNVIDNLSEKIHEKTSPWELMDPKIKNDLEKTQEICITFDP